MRRLFVSLIVGFVFISFLLTFSLASDNPMFDFYNGLTGIVEKNMNNPTACAAQAENYIKKNIGALLKTAEAGRKMAQQKTQQYENMSKEDLEAALAKAEKAMSDPKIAASMNKSMMVMNKFMEVMTQFTMKHPDEGDRIMETLSEYSPQNEMYSK